MFCRFYPASRTLSKVCRFFLRLMCFIYRISLWFERFRMGFVEIYGVMIEFIKFFYYFLITFAMLWSIFTDFFSVLDSLTGFSCELYHVYAYVLQVLPSFLMIICGLWVSYWVNVFCLLDFLEIWHILGGVCG